MRRKLTLALLLGLVPLVALGVAASLIARSSERASVRDRAERTAELRAVAVEQQAQRVEIELAAMAEWPDLILPSIGVARGGGADQQAAAQSALEVTSTWWRGFVGLGVVGADGGVIARWGAFGSLDPLLADRLSSGHPTPTFVSGADGGSFVHFAVPLVGSDGDAALVGVVPADTFARLGPAGPGDVLRLADGELALVLTDQATTGSTFIAAGAVDALRPGGYDGSVNVPLAGTRAVAATAVGGTDWTLTAGVDPAGSGVTGRIVFAGVAAAVVLAGLAYLLARMVGGAITRRLNRIETTAGAILEGDLDRRIGDTAGDELGIVSARIDEMAESLVSDIARRREMETLLVQQALHDPLTGLANRAKLVDRLGDSLLNSARTGRYVGLLFCDLDGFKAVNDSLGHAVGDELLMAVANRFRSTVRPSDTVARFGGDEFVVLCSELSQPSDAEAVAERIQGAFAEPFAIGTERITTSSSIGIAVASGGTVAPNDLLRMADQAMYRAKAAGKARSEVYAESSADDDAERAARAALVRSAIEDGQLLLHHQPIVNLQTNEVVGLEAFVRWQHPERGSITPRELIALATSAGLAAEVDLWVLERAAREALAWRTSTGRPDTTITVNLTPGSLGSPGFAESVAATIERLGLDPASTCLDVSEASLTGEPGRVLAALDDLRAVGVSLAIDDFGTGHSSLDRLRRCPVQSIKIHQTLVNGVVSDDDDRAAVRAILSMAATLGLDVSAEGIETVEQRHVLAELGCELGQGFLFSPPAPLDELAVFGVRDLPVGPERSAEP